MIAAVADQRPRTSRLVAAFLVMAGVGVALVAAAPTPALGARVALAAVGMVAVALAWIDVRWLVIPDAYSLALAVLGLLGPLRQPLALALAGLLVGGGLLGAVWLLWRRLTGSEGLGLGDVKLAGALGCLLGPQAVLRAICIAAIAGAAMGLAMRARRRAQGQAGEHELFPLGAGLGLSSLGLLCWTWLR